MKKAFARKIILATASLLFVLCICLVSDRSRAKSILTICPQIERSTSCRVSSVSTAGAWEKELRGEALHALLEQLRKAQCYRVGNTNGIFEGELYRLYFSDDKNVVAEIAVTSQGKLSVGSHTYDLRPDALSVYLEHIS